MAAIASDFESTHHRTSVHLRDLRTLLNAVPHARKTVFPYTLTSPVQYSSPPSF